MNTHWSRGFVTLAVLSGVLLAPPGSAQAQAQPAAQRAWGQIVPHLRHAEENSAAALEAALQRIDGVFTQAKEGVKPFTDEVFGFEAKAHMAVGAAGQLISGVGSLIQGAYQQLRGGDALSSPPPASDRFRDFVEARFQRHVLAPGAVKDAVQEAVASYRDALETAERELAVDVRDANGGRPLAIGRGPSGLDLLNVGDGAGDEAVDGAAEAAVTAQKDAFVQIGAFAGSWILAGFLGGQMGFPTDYSTVGLLASFGLGSVLDMFTEVGFAASGYTPQKQAQKRVEEALERMRTSLLDGDPDAVKAHTRLCRLSERHPDAAVRTHCATALKAVEGKARLGLRQSLTRVHELRAHERTSRLHRQLFGADLPPEFDATAGGGDTSPEIITWADGLAKTYGEEE